MSREEYRFCGKGKGVYLSVALEGALDLFESAFPEIGSGSTSS